MKSCVSLVIKSSALNSFIIALLLREMIFHLAVREYCVVSQIMNKMYDFFDKSLFKDVNLGIGKFIMALHQVDILDKLVTMHARKLSVIKQAYFQPPNKRVSDQIKSSRVIMILFRFSRGQVWLGQTKFGFIEDLNGLVRLLGTPQ